MPVSLKRNRTSGALYFLHTCEIDGCKKSASFGVGVKFRAAMDALRDKKPTNHIKWLLGKWYCGEHV